MKANADINVMFNKVGLDENTLQLLREYTESQAKGTKKTYRLEVGDEAKGIVSGFVALGVLGIIAYATTSIIKIIYGTGS